MKTILSILLALAMLLTLAGGAAAEAGSGAVYSEAGEAETLNDTDRTACSLGGFAFTVPAGWQQMKSSDPESGHLGFNMGSGSIMSVMMIMVENDPEMKQYADSEGVSALYEELINTLAETYQGEAAEETAAWGAVEGSWFVIHCPSETMVGFMSLQGDSMLVLMGEDPSMSEEQLTQLIREVVESVTW